MTRAAIYARYSSDLQSPASIGDQVRLCREHAARAGLEVVETYADAALSGADARHRPSLQRLLADAKLGRFDVVLAEALDRISRDQEDTAGLFKRLTHVDVRIVTVSEGEISELHVGLKGTMNALFLKDLAQKVRRGQRGRLEAGRSPGGLAYGYRVVVEVDARGRVERGNRAIDEAQAAIVRRIFAEYLAGRRPREIASALNHDGVPGPRGGAWGVSTIVGARGRATGILNNPVYLGRLVYGRQTFRRDPDTGKRVPRTQPASERVSIEVPHLRIIDDARWAKVAAMKASAGERPLWLRRGPKHLLSGLVVCTACDGPYIVHTKRLMICRNHAGRGTCANDRMVPIAELTARALAGLRAQLLEPERIAAFVEEHRLAAQALARAARARDSGRRREIVETQKCIRSLVDAIAKGGDFPALAVGLREYEQRAAELAAEEAEAVAADVAVSIHPRVADLYRRRVADLERVCGGESAPAAEARDLVRQMIDRIEITPGPVRGQWRAALWGQLADLLAATGQAERTGAAELGQAVAVGGFAFRPTLGPVEI